MRRFKAQPDAAISTIEGESLKINLQQKKCGEFLRTFYFLLGFCFFFLTLFFATGLLFSSSK